MSYQDNVDAVNLVQELFPTIGPHTPERLVQATVVIDEMVRYLAHATHNSRETSSDASELASAVGNLGHALGSLGQVQRQLRQACSYLSAENGLRHDEDRTKQSAATAAYLAGQYLAEAAGKTHDVGQLVDKAFGCLNHLYLVDDDGTDNIA